MSMHKKIESKGLTLWFTGLSGAGKTTIADKLVPLMKNRGFKVERLDGDIVRQSLTKDLGFSREDRYTNIERVTFVAKLLTRNDVAVLATFISPYRDMRQKSREEIGNFIEVFVKCSVDGCAKRDVKGMYKKAFAGIIKEFTGVSDPYEEPLNPEITLDTEKYNADECVNQVMDRLHELGYLHS